MTLATPPTHTPMLSALVLRRLLALIERFSEMPDAATLRSVTTVAEILLLDLDNETLAAFRAPVVEFAATLAQRAALDEIIFCDSKLAYCAALLAYLATKSEAFDPAWFRNTRRLMRSGYALRSEFPVMTRVAVGMLLQRATIGEALAPPLDLGRMLSRRLLRARDDHFDLMLLIMAGQMRALDVIEGDEEIAYYCRALLTSALRRGYDAWVPPIACVLRLFGEVPPYLHTSVHARVDRIVCAGELPPPILVTGITDEMFLRSTEEAIALRSAIGALILAGGNRRA